MIDAAPERVEETPAEDRETWMVVLFGGTGPALLEELDENPGQAAVGPLRIGSGRFRDYSSCPGQGGENNERHGRAAK